MGPVVGSTFFSAEGHRVGLYVAWHLGQPWYGDVRSRQLEVYKRSGAKYTIAIPGSSLAEKLATDGIRDVSDSLDGNLTLRVFEILPGHF